MVNWCNVPVNDPKAQVSFLEKELSRLEKSIEKTSSDRDLKIVLILRSAQRGIHKEIDETWHYSQADKEAFRDDLNKLAIKSNLTTPDEPLVAKLQGNAFHTRDRFEDASNALKHRLDIQLLEKKLHVLGKDHSFAKEIQERIDQNQKDLKTIQDRLKASPGAKPGAKAGAKSVAKPVASSGPD